MNIELHPKFIKLFKKRIAINPKLVIKFKERIQLFIKDPYHPLLQNHKLEGKKVHLNSFSVTGDLRVVYYMKDSDVAVFLEIGTHNQVY